MNVIAQALSWNSCSSNIFEIVVTFLLVSYKGVLIKLRLNLSLGEGF